MIKKIKKIVFVLIKYIYAFISEFITVDKDLVIFISFHGRGFSDNPRAIYEALINDSKYSNLKYIWVINNHKQKNIYLDDVKIIDYNSLSFFYYMCKAKYWIINCKMPEYIVKKENQIYLQTWHGTPLKRLGHDIQVSEDTTFYRSGLNYEEMCKTYDVDVEKYNYMISPNKFCTEVFQSSFGINKERLIETGYPRNDFITNATKEDIINIKNKYHLPLDKKIILYAPTWRDNSYNVSGYTFELKADFYKWKEILKDEYIIVFKPHYLIVNKYENNEDLKDFLYSIPANAEINELYVISDSMITDYSSVFYDYAVLNRPMYFYMYDLEEYREELRGFYLDIYTELPGKIFEDEDMLLNDIKNNVYDYESLKIFNERFSHAQTGNCAQKVIDIVFEV